MVRSGTLHRMEPEVRRRAAQLLLGILALGVVIALCIAALVFLLDRFTAKAARDCERTHCRESHSARVAGWRPWMPFTSTTT